MVSAPTRGADAAALESWKQRQGLARLVWTLAMLAPPFVSGLATWFLRGSYLHPDGLWGDAAWIGQVAVTGIAIAIGTERIVRRLIPLTHLLRLSLHFPDKAPSRYSVALRTGTIKQQQQILSSVEEHGFSKVDHEAFEQLVAMVMALGRHERLTRGHTERVRAYTDLIAAEMGLPVEDRQKLHWAALLHDIGKLRVPSELLALAGPPNDEQWETIKQHPAHGAEMVERFADWLGDWRFAAGDHHERWDGGGYPRGVAGLDISLAGRIVAVADAFDVITSARSYKKAATAETARAELVRCAGSQFDPVVVRAFLRVSTGDLHATTGRMAWTASVPGILASAGQVVAIPLAIAAGVISFPATATGAGVTEANDVEQAEDAGDSTQLSSFGVAASPTPASQTPGEHSDGDDEDPDATDPSATDPDATDPDPTGDETSGDSATSTPTVPAHGGPPPEPTPTTTTVVLPPGGPTVGIPDVPVPTVTTLPIPTVEIPDLPIPTVEIPDLPIPIPTVEIPDLPIPTVEVPDLPIPTPTIEVPDLPIPTPTVYLPIPTPTVNLPGLPGL